MDANAPVEARAGNSSNVNVSHGDGRIALSEVVSALSFALDLTEDAVPGHAVRSCLIGMQLGHALTLPDTDLGNLYYALLLKDVGCSSNSARMCQILGGDDRKAKRDVKIVDWTKPTIAGIEMAWVNALPGAKPWQKAARLLRLSLEREQNNEEMISLRCDRGASIIRKIGLSEECANAVYFLDEHWNGKGYPHHLHTDSTPLLARILGVAQHLDVFAGEQGRDRAIETLTERGGSWFDPDLVRLAVSLHQSGTLWRGCNTQEEHQRAMDLEPGETRTIDANQTDRICEAFADVVDAKSSFTYRHSMGVTRAAEGIARQLGLQAEQRKLVYRAALLHDLGKLRVPNTILDKPGKLDEDEWAIMREHPLLSERILERIPSFASIAVIVGRHHEKLDGSGYPYRLRGDQISIEDRILTVADIYSALSEDRPYRAGSPMEQVVEIMEKDVPLKLDADCFEALLISAH